MHLVDTLYGMSSRDGPDEERAIHEAHHVRTESSAKSVLVREAYFYLPPDTPFAVL